MYAMLRRESFERKNQISINVNFTMHNRNVFFLKQIICAEKSRRHRIMCDRDTGGANRRVGESRCESGGHDKETALEPKLKREHGPPCRPQERSSDQEIEEPLASRRTKLCRDSVGMG